MYLSISLSLSIYLYIYIYIHMYINILHIYIYIYTLYIRSYNDNISNTYLLSLLIILLLLLCCAELSKSWLVKFPLTSKSTFDAGGGEPVDSFCLI